MMDTTVVVDKIVVVPWDKHCVIIPRWLYSFFVQLYKVLGIFPNILGSSHPRIFTVDILGYSILLSEDVNC